MRVDDIDLSNLDFWSAPLAQREEAFGVLRDQKHRLFLPEPESPLGQGPGYWSLTRHADVDGDFAPLGVRSGAGVGADG